MDPRTHRASRLLAAGVLGILAASLTSRAIARLARSGNEPGLLDDIALFFSVDGERNLPASASGALFIATGLLCLVAAARSEARPRWAWRFFAATTLAMAADELFEIHERLLRWVGESVGLESGGVIFFVWVIPGAFVAASLVAVAAWLTRPLAPWQRRGALLAAIVFFGGALGVETVTGALYDEGGSSLAYVLLQLVEEGMEFTGLSIMFLIALESASRLQPASLSSVDPALGPRRPAMATR